MGSRAPQTHAIPGPPSGVELAYLAGLFDRAGGLTLNPLGLKLRVADLQGLWLERRFGGHWRCDPFAPPGTPEHWWLSTQTELLDTLMRLHPYVLGRVGELEAMILLLQHVRDRRSYHGDDEWRQTRSDLMDALRHARRREPVRAMPQSPSASPTSP